MQLDAKKLGVLVVLVQRRVVPHLFQVLSPPDNTRGSRKKKLTAALQYISSRVLR